MKLIESVNGIQTKGEKMIKFNYYNQGGYKKIIKVSDNDFTVMLLNGSLAFSHENESGKWYKDCGCGVYLIVNQ